MLQEWTSSAISSRCTSARRLPQIAFLDPATGARRRVQFPRRLRVSPDKNPEYDQKELRVVYQSPVTPQSWLDVDAASSPESRQRSRCRTTPSVRGGAIWAPADGEGAHRVLHKKGAARDGKSPLLLYGYAPMHRIADRFNSNVFRWSIVGVQLCVATSAAARDGKKCTTRPHDEQDEHLQDLFPSASTGLPGYTRRMLAICGRSRRAVDGGVTNLPRPLHAVVTYVLSST